MINLEKSKEQFIKYTENYDLQKHPIKGKQEHSLRVMQISKQIAEGLNLSQDEIELAALIGLLHDIARFEQYTKYATFKDWESFDHGDFGADILKEDIRKYIETDKYDQIIIKSVKNHNKFEIEKGLTEKELIQAQIIRDADKIDILSQAVTKFWNGKEQLVENSKVSQGVVEQIKNHTLIKRRKEETPVENVMSVIGFIFDINFKTSLQAIKQEDCINKILDRYNFKDEYTKQKVEEIKRITNEYIEKNAK